MNKPNRNVKTGSKDQKEVFFKKLEMCKTILDMNGENKNQNEQQARLQLLQDLTEMLVDARFISSVCIPNLGSIMEMISINIFRPLPSSKKALGQSETGEEEETNIDQNWPHLLGVYEFFYQLIVNEATDVKTLKVHINQKFIYDFLDLFDSEEPKERD